jgi:hypothetical protein
MFPDYIPTLPLSILGINHTTIFPPAPVPLHWFSRQLRAIAHSYYQNARSGTERRYGADTQSNAISLWESRYWRGNRDDGEVPC